MQDVPKQCKEAFPTMEGAPSNEISLEDLRNSTAEQRALQKQLADSWGVPKMDELFRQAKVAGKCSEIVQEQAEIDRVLSSAADEVAKAILLNRTAAIYPLKAVDNGDHNYKLTAKEQKILDGLRKDERISVSIKNGQQLENVKLNSTNYPSGVAYFWIIATPKVSPPEKK